MGKSSKDKRDAYYRLAKEQGWRARSAFKLLQIDADFDILSGVTRIVDLCAAPGSWSQVLSRQHSQEDAGLVERYEGVNECWTDPDAVVVPEDQVELYDMKEKLKETIVHLSDYLILRGREPKGRNPSDRVIVAVDLQPLVPLPGITMLRADITDPSTTAEILSIFGKRENRLADLVLSDGAPDGTSLHHFDAYIQRALLYAALDLAVRILAPGGTFIAKVFRVKGVEEVFRRLREWFGAVTIAKPKASRASSVESFVVCRGFIGGAKTINHEDARRRDATLQRMQGPRELGERAAVLNIEELEESDDAQTVPCVSCGGERAYDSDKTYRLPAERTSLEPVQPPTSPPYKRALELRRLGAKHSEAM